MRGAETTEAERAFLLDTLQNASLVGPHLEIGTAAAGTLREIVNVYPPGARPKFVVVDPLTYFQGQKSLIASNLKAYGIDPASIEFVETTSTRAFRRSSFQRFSFIFIDAVHDATHVTQDLAWTRFLEEDGLLARHDYSPRFPGVMAAVDRYLCRNAGYEAIGVVDSLIIIAKRAKSLRPEVGVLDRLFAAMFDLRVRAMRSYAKRKPAWSA